MSGSAAAMTLKMSSRWDVFDLLLYWQRFDAFGRVRSNHVLLLAKIEQGAKTSQLFVGGVGRDLASLQYKALNRLLADFTAR